MSAILRFPAACSRLGLSKDTVRRRCTPTSRYFDPSFPQPMRLGTVGRALGFIESELDAWIEQRAAARQSERVAA